MSEENGVIEQFNPVCPAPAVKADVIRLGHGSGGKMTADLIEREFMPKLQNDVLRQMNDAADVAVGASNIAITTDSYVVNPIFFPGGDIGSLSVNGTVNDLSMRGARPLFLTAAFILEEGLALADLRKIVGSVSRACNEAGVQLVAADTKVVNRKAADQLFITTSGVGLIETSQPPSANRARPGDSIIVSGDIGLHGMAIMCAREGLELETRLESDCAPLNRLVDSMLDACDSIHCLRDLTRGGLASALNELALASGVGIAVEEESIPVHPEVQAACEILGLDPLYVACEGRLVAIAPAETADNLLSAMKKQKIGAGSRIIGKVVDEHPGGVLLRTKIGGRRIVDRLSGEQLPRIC